MNCRSENKCCNHNCNEGRDCPEDDLNDWSYIAIIVASAALVLSIVMAGVIFIRWMIGA